MTPYITNTPHAATGWQIVSKLLGRSFLTIVPLRLARRDPRSQSSQP